MLTSGTIRSRASVVVIAKKKKNNTFRFASDRGRSTTFWGIYKATISVTFYAPSALSRGDLHRDAGILQSERIIMRNGSDWITGFIE
jgi:hypothetical protein